MTENGVIEAQAVVVHEDQAVMPLLEGQTPADRVTFAYEVARALAPIVDKANLSVNIQRRKHVLYEGWTTLGALLGVFPVTVWTRQLEDGWEARVEARTRDGAVVGAAEAECTRSENTWKSRDSYALRSMAQTRAGSKALRMPLGFIMHLAGFDTTPAEEMPSEPRQKAMRNAVVVESAEQQEATLRASLWSLAQSKGFTEESLKEFLGTESLKGLADYMVGKVCSTEGGCGKPHGVKNRAAAYMVMLKWIESYQPEVSDES